MDLAIKDVRHHLGKFAVTIVGVSLLLTIVLIMNGIYQGNISDGLWLIDNTRADLWVVERNRGGPFNEQSRVAEDVYRSVAAVPGVAQSSPFITYNVEREVAGTSQHFTIIGYDVFGGLGGPARIVTGRPITRAHYELVADEKLGLRLAEVVRLGVHDYEVVGLTRGAVDFGGNPLAYLSLHDAQEVLFQQDNRALQASRAAALRRLERAGTTSEEAARLAPLLSAPTDTTNAVLVRLVPGVDRRAVAQHIEEWLYLSAFTPEQQRDLMLKGRLQRMMAILGLFRSLLVVVSIIIIALIVYVLTIEKIKSIATLKLLGATNWVIVRLILEQSLVLTVAAFLLAWASAELVKDSLPRSLLLLPAETLVTFLVIFAGGIVASLMAIWRALRTPPSLALGG
jgi:putative ABC transport system permease protein